MRPRIKNRVNIEESILEMKRRKDAYTSAIKDIMAGENIELDMDWPTDLELAELAAACIQGDDEDDDEEEDFQPF